ncbi:MAG TPA: mercury methylation corrinoid protein HgcA [Nitrospirota bacterium]|nr:mercury methylation corrinoid protein HgcA [Nitrospirota bacterium]
MPTMQTLKFVKKDLPRWAAGTVPTPVGPVNRITSDWSRADHWGMIKSRVSAFRMSYSVTPGLYAIGDPAKESDVFVTANYKLTFDTLRRELKGFNAWVLVLDTKSINVWCAAGKGTFGTGELVNRISSARLDAVVSHRRLILPQLGAVGVNAAEVKKKTGFLVSFGPVEARDIPAYIRNGYTKTTGMSTIRFTMIDRLILTPMELNPAMKKFPWIAAGILLIFGLQPSGLLFHEAWTGGLPFLLLTLIAILAGALITPVLLPYVPFRSFALKGWIVGALFTVPALQLSDLTDPHDGVLRIAAAVLFPALSSYLALQFTGATTFTSMSGVKKEMRLGIPLYIGAAAVSLILVIIYKMKEWRLV